MLPDNYRPISLLPVLSKLMFVQTTKYINNNSLLYMKQFGFRENHSTQHVITNLVSDILVL